MNYACIHFIRAAAAERIQYVINEVHISNVYEFHKQLQYWFLVEKQTVS